jgi:hypothetical protein
MFLVKYTNLNTVSEPRFFFFKKKKLIKREEEKERSSPSVCNNVGGRSMPVVFYCLWWSITSVGVVGG